MREDALTEIKRNGQRGTNMGRAETWLLHFVHQKSTPRGGKTTSRPGEWGKNKEMNKDESHQKFLMIANSSKSDVRGKRSARQGVTVKKSLKRSQEKTGSGPKEKREARSIRKL